MHREVYIDNWLSTHVDYLLISKYWSVVNNNNDIVKDSPDDKVHGANMGPTWVLSAPDGPYVGPMNLAIRVSIEITDINNEFI